MDKEENYLLGIDLAKGIEYAQYLDRKEGYIDYKKNLILCKNISDKIIQEYKKFEDSHNIDEK